MRNFGILFLSWLALMLWLGTARGTIVIDETFDDGTPWTDLGWMFGVDNPTSAGVKGINVYRSSYADMPATATLAFSAATGNQQGELVSPGNFSSKAWKLAQGQKLFWGRSGMDHVESGDGLINSEKSNTTIAQIGIAYYPAVLALPNNTVVGQIRYMFGSASTYTLTYNLRVNTTSNGLAVEEYRATSNFDGTKTRNLGVIPPNKFSMLTTVWTSIKSATDPHGFWGTIPKKYLTGSLAVSTVGSADGNLYPYGKGWQHGQRLCSTIGDTTETLVYSFLDKKPVTASTETADLDGGWRILDIGNTANWLRTWKISVPDTPGAMILVDDIYMENTVRSLSMNDLQNKAADYRLHEFDQTKRYRRDPADPDPSNPTMFIPNANPQYVRFYPETPTPTRTPTATPTATATPNPNSSAHGWSLYQ